MVLYPLSFQKLVRELAKLPTIGERTATRLAYHIIANDPALAPTLASALADAVAHISLCSRCYFFSEGGALCPICRDERREGHIICVVEKPADVVAIERAGEYRGVYHVLHGVWAPLRGVAPEDIRIKELLARIEGEEVREVIIATGATVEGDATALYIGQELRDRGVVSSRIAQGIPKGGELEAADELTLARALSGRTRFGG
jgi:recombination protein RecR